MSAAPVRHLLPPLEEIAASLKVPKAALHELNRRHKTVRCGVCQHRTRVRWANFRFQQHYCGDSNLGCEVLFVCGFGCGLVLAQLRTDLVLKILALINALPSREQCAAK